MRWLLPLVLLAIMVSFAGCSSDNGNGASSGSASPAASATATRSPGGSSAPDSLLPSPNPNAPLYIALGDSLSAGVGATDRTSTAFVPLVQKGLPAGTGLLNLGQSGDTSANLLDHGHVARAVSEIQARNHDNNPDNDVKLVTVEIGGNDLLGLFFTLVVPGKCPNVTEGLQRPECVNALRDVFEKYTPNLKSTLDQLQAADPNVKIALLTLYNPFSGGAAGFDALAQLALEGMPDTPFPDGLNDLIRAQAQSSNVTLVDSYPLFAGKAHQYIAVDLIHPNDAGYRVIADAVLQAIGS